MFSGSAEAGLKNDAARIDAKNPEPEPPKQMVGGSKWHRAVRVRICSK
jgi:hypothetical protein